MTDKRNAGFFLSTLLKLAVYLLICGVCYVLGLWLFPKPFNYIIPPVMGGVVTWFFLTVMEGGRRSYFAKGYMLENIVPGAVTGVIAYVLPAAAEYFLMGNLRISGFSAGFDIREPLYETFATGLFAGIVIFGYFFHIIMHDINSAAAVVLSAGVYFVFRFYGMKAMMHIAAPAAYDIPMYTETVGTAFYIGALVCTGTAAGLAVLYFGDMRSASAFLSLLCLAENSVFRLFDCEYRGVYVKNADFMYVSPCFAIIMFIICVWLIVKTLTKE